MSLPQNPRAVVTGAGSGIGRAFSIDLARRGGSVLCADLDLGRAEETARLVGQAGGVGVATVCDVARLEDVERLLVEAEAKLGGVDVIINNAGVGCAGLVGEVSITDWRWLLDIDLYGVIYGCHVFAPYLRAKGRGHLINVASIAGIVAGPRMGPYNVAKAGVIALSETLSAELDGSGVGVTVLCPSFIKTQILDGSRGDDERGRVMAQKMMDRASMTADDVAKVTLDAAARNELYVMPQTDARWMWRLKRIDPVRFYRTLAPAVARMVTDPKGADPVRFARSIFKSVTGRA